MRVPVSGVGLGDRAAEVLRGNDLGSMTAAAPRLYPHMWSWDSGLIAVGLARLSVPRAITELRTLLRAQWSTGMIPHIVFSAGDGYFPGPERWGTESAAAAPRTVRTSGICQPPVHALAVRRILDAGRAAGGEIRDQAEAFVRETFGSWLAWHRWLAGARDPDRRGLVEIYHGWESGMDNSPRWDRPYAAVVPGDDLPGFVRTDLHHVGDVHERPTDDEYGRYLWIVEQLRRVRYDDAAARDVVGFRVADVFMSAILAVASDELAGLGDELGRVDDAAELRELAARFRAGVASTVSPTTGLGRDLDRRSGRWIETETVAGFAPLFCGVDDGTQRALFWGERWCGHPALAHPLPPSVSPADPGMRPRTYWRGPVWPIVSWLFGWALERQGDDDGARRLREASLRQLADGDFGEYYEPFTGEPLGSLQQSWTAAVTLDWLAP
ncbi:glucosylglycerate hydrolase [Jiangella anatolica]|uniref:Glycogen debranching protein n=1 Tax=Jiangella anatolica TaxID=2670374 RepID=A0A2W2BXY4_9ACTN|nr:glycoside hydrolase 100 family protein [Jiangella anatolica]PZF80477.1 glycogen debranching protein [Jiangella anatolica]